MTNFKRNVNQPEDETPSPGATLGLRFTVSEKVLLGFLGLALSFGSGFTYGNNQEALAAARQAEPVPTCQQQ